MHQPRLVILDEPFSGLDPINVELMKNIILEMKESGCCVIFSTHLMEQAEKLCNAICLINKGQCVLEGELSQVKKRFGKKNVLTEVESGRLTALLIIPPTIFAALGATVNSQEEAQQLQFPVVIFLVVPLLLLNFIVNNPNAAGSAVISFIPFFKPSVMFTRIVVDTPPFGEILLSLGVMMVSIYLMVLLAGKIYRVGMLMYGKRPTLPEVIRWVRY